MNRLETGSAAVPLRFATQVRDQGQSGRRGNVHSAAGSGSSNLHKGSGTVTLWLAAGRAVSLVPVLASWLLPAHWDQTTRGTLRTRR